MTDQPNTRVLSAINSVQRAVAEVGIAKDRRNTDQGFNYRGIDDVYNVVGPILANAGLFILPVGMERTVSPFKSSRGTEGQHAVVQGHFRWQHVEGEHLDIEAYGEATDYQHRAVAKAMSTAYKNMLFSVLCIPIGGVDADDGEPSTTRNPMADLRAFMNTHHLSERDVCTFAEVASLDLIDNPGAVLAQISERVTTLSSSVTKTVAAADRCMVPPRVIAAYVEQVLDAPTAWEGMQVWRGIGDQAVQVLVWSRLGSRERTALKAAKEPAAEPTLSQHYRNAFERITEAANEDRLNAELDDIIESGNLTPTELADITVYAQSREFPAA